MIKFLISIILLFSFAQDLFAITKIAILPHEEHNLQNSFITRSINDILISRLSKPNELEITEIKNIPQKESLTKIGERLKSSNIDYFIRGKVIQSNKVNQIELFLFNTSTLQPELHLKYNSENLDGLITEISKFSLEIVSKIKSETKLKNQPKIEITKINPDAPDRPILLNAPESDADLTHRIHPDKLLTTRETNKKQNLEKTIYKERLKSKIEGAKERPELISTDSEKNPPKHENKTTTPVEFFTEKERLRANLQTLDSSQNTQQRPILTLERNPSQKELQKASTKATDKKPQKTLHSSDLPYPSPYELKPIGKSESPQNPKSQTPVSFKDTPIYPTEKPTLNTPANTKTP